MPSYRISSSHAAAALVAIVGFGLALGGGVVGIRPAAARPAAAQPTLAELVGQRLVVAIRGTRPSAGILERIRQGEIGGVILFGGNISGPAQLQQLTSTLQVAARAGGQPRLLIATDQEGGTVRRLAWAAPDDGASVLGGSSAASIRKEARLAGLAMRAGGVTVDLAPVADVAGPGSFLAAQGRTFGSTPAVVSPAVSAFTQGLADAHVAATVKHFPGIGDARQNTDRFAIRIGLGRPALDRGLAPFRAAIDAGAPLVMVSNASYAALDGKPAAWSPAVQRLLRGELGFSGVTMTDALDGTAATRARALSSVAVLSAQAGVDLLLLIGSESSSDEVYGKLLAAAESGRIPSGSLRRSYERIQSLKRAYG